MKKNNLNKFGFVFVEKKEYNINQDEWLSHMKTITQYQRKRILLGENNNMVLRLVFINAIAYLFFSFIKVYYLLNGLNFNSFLDQVVPWFTLPASLSQLITRPWTLVTFMFVHVSFWNIASNMLWLWWFGSILQDFFGHKKVVPLYLYGGLTGALFFLLVYNLSPSLYNAAPHAAALSASASIMAIAFAVTIMVPGYRVFPMLRGGIPLWIITVLYVVIDLISLPQNNAGGYAIHAGGAVMGIIFAWQFKKGNDWSAGLSNFLFAISHIFDPKEKKEVSVRRRFFYKQEITPFKKIGTVTHRKIDQLLDKINEHGYDSLTQEEKEVLMRASQQQDD